MRRSSLKILDSVITFAMIFSVYMWGNGWFVVPVVLYGLWNYSVGLAHIYRPTHGE